MWGEYEDISQANQGERPAARPLLFDNPAWGVESPIPAATIDAMVQRFLEHSARTRISFNTPLEHIFCTPEQLLLSEVLQERTQQPMQLSLVMPFSDTLDDPSDVSPGSFLSVSMFAAFYNGFSILSSMIRIWRNPRNPEACLDAHPADSTVPSRKTDVASLKRSFSVSDGDSSEADPSRLRKKPRRGKRVPTSTRRARWREASVEEDAVQITLQTHTST